MENTQTDVWTVRKHIKPLSKKFIKDFLFTLRHTSHPVFALFDHLPTDQFRIERHYDYKEAKDDYEYKATPDRYTLGEFYKQAASLHKNDEFNILFGTNRLYYEDELTLSKVNVLAERFLQEQCEKGLRANTPIRLTQELIKKYGLTKTDAPIVGACLAKCNNTATIKIQAEYDALRVLDCVKK